MSIDLKRKIASSIRLLQSIPDDKPIEIAYSGGKDSDVILELAKMAKINYRAIYKNTTIDPPGTIAHVVRAGAEIVRPRESFFHLMRRKGFPSRDARFCCEVLKEYKILDRAILGIRRCESPKRAARYEAPEVCRVYSKKDKTKNARHYFPILEWSDKDIADFIAERNIKCHPLYYDDMGVFHPERRLGCMCCPLASKKHRLAEFMSHPNMVKAYCRAAGFYWDAHPKSPMRRYISDVYEWFVMHLFCNSKQEFKERFGKSLFYSRVDCKSFLEDYFHIKF